MQELLSTGDVAELLGVKRWQVQRLYEDGDLPEPDRFAGKRAIPRRQLASVAAALRARGWLPASAPAPLTATSTEGG